ncbi:MAG: phosphoribosylanthranilate isomerase [Rubripirellula sp.]
MFHTKICGVQKASDIEAVIASAADAIGLNFFPPSVRYVDPKTIETAKLSRQASAGNLFRVGVFVNEPAEVIADIAAAVQLDAIQLHGDETPSTASRVKLITNLPVIRAIKLPTQNLTLAEIEERTKPWSEAGFHLLLDADAGKAHGGSGKTIDWAVVREWSHANPNVRWTLAGGLDVDNVAEAIRISGATSVDTASGVEELRGEKSLALIEQFASAAQT